MAPKKSASVNKYASSSPSGIWNHANKLRESYTHLICVVYFLFFFSNSTMSYLLSLAIYTMKLKSAGLAHMVIVLKTADWLLKTLMYRLQQPVTPSLLISLQTAISALTFPKHAYLYY